MTVRQRILRWAYPVLMLFRKPGKKVTKKYPSGHDQSPVSFYSLNAELNSGRELDFDSLRGRQVLLVNTASNCGYTSQYDELQLLYEKYQDQLVVIGFPANDFKEQEKGSDEQIAEFCRINFGVSFPLAKKSTVVKGDAQNPVFRWLTDPALNGWNNTQPEWNFSKYLVDERGILLHYYPPSVSPLGSEILEAIKKS